MGLGKVCVAGSEDKPLCVRVCVLGNDATRRGSVTHRKKTCVQLCVRRIKRKKSIVGFGLFFLSPHPVLKNIYLYRISAESSFKVAHLVAVVREADWCLSNVKCLA